MCTDLCIALFQQFIKISYFAQMLVHVVDGLIYVGYLAVQVDLGCENT